MNKILIEKDKLKLYLYKDDNLIKTYPIAIGKPNTPTPEGKARIINRAVNPGGPYGLLWLGLSIPHIGIHGTNDPSSIGTMASHGCVRMYNKDILELSKLAPIGTEVNIVSKSDSESNDQPSLA